MSDICIWSQDGRTESFSTACKKWFDLNDGTPSENGMKFCCFCGKPITQDLYQEPKP